MKSSLLLCAAFALVGLSAPSARAAAPDPFPPADLMRIGAYYYPEAWPEAQWPRDMANIKKLGMEFVHMGEFAWALMEPQEGRFDFAWLDRNIELAHAQGLKVVLCTPSPTPPVWLTERHPEVLMIDADGRRQAHGTREQACWSVEVYRQNVARIVRELGQRYGHDPRVWGWQLDNELSHYGKEPCFCDTCERKFQAWLEKKYATVEALNRDWGNQFWSQIYQRFDQIRLPNEKENVAQFNPHQMLDAQRWFADEAADYLRFQTGILREYCGDRQWITTNYIHNFSSVDPELNRSDFEIMSYTIYPVDGELKSGALGFRLGSAPAFSFAANFHRAIGGRYGVMELQPGQVNWGPVNPQLYPGIVHLWLLRSFALGAKFVCTYRYRQPLYGAELYHYGLVGPDGVTPTSGGEQYAQAAREVAQLRTKATPGLPLPAAYAARRAAVLYSRDARWDIDNHKQNIRWNTLGHLLKYQSALSRVGAPVDFIGEDKDFSGYPVLVVPACQLVDEKLVARWKAYAENGGQLILSCRTGQKDRRGHLWEAAWSHPILDLVGAKIDFYDVLPSPVTGQLQAGAELHRWSTWGEVLRPGPEATVLATYADHFYAGGVAAVTRKLGKGSVTYIGVDSDRGTLEAQLVREVYGRAGIPVADYAEDFCVDWRDGLWVATNFSDRPQVAPVPAGAEILVGRRDVPVAGVTVWR